MTFAGIRLGGMVMLLAGSGVLHLVAPQPYRRIIPGPLQAYARGLVFWSGLIECACAALLCVPRTRRLAAIATAALLIGVFPANIQMAVDMSRSSGRGSQGQRLRAWLRLPLQVPLVLWAWRLRRA